MHESDEQYLYSKFYEVDYFWHVTPCSLIDIGRRFRGAYCLHHQDDEMMETVSSSETSVNIYQTTRCSIPEDSRLHTRRRENLKSHLQNFSQKT
jgi:hypothetical protein